MKKAIAFLLIVAGVCAAGYPIVTKLATEEEITQVITSYNRETQDSAAMEQYADDADAYNAELFSSGAVSYDPFVVNSGYMVETSSVLDDYASMLDYGDVMGYLSIPKIDVTLPIYHDTTASVLDKGIGHLKTSSLPVGGANTHAVLCGHSGMQTALFSDLNKLETGDMFTVRAANRTLTYEVVEIKTVLPTEMQSLAIQEGSDLVTLMTCTPIGTNSHRLLVTGERVETDSESAETKTEDTVTVHMTSTWLTQYLLSLAIGTAAAAVVILLIVMVKKH